MALASASRYRLSPISKFAAALFSSGPSTTVPPPDLARGATADLCDVGDEVKKVKVQIADPIFRDLGGKLAFNGQAVTIKCFENNPLVRKTLEGRGDGKVLVVDGGGSTRVALLGDNVATLAYTNGWEGVILNACIRDSAEIKDMPLGVKAIGTCPRKSAKRDPGELNVPVRFGGVSINPGDYVYADSDGILVCEHSLLEE